MEIDQRLKNSGTSWAVYINREGNQGAKAGNINNALKQITSDLIIVFDADFVAFKDC